MKIYLVGGAVRDALLKQKTHDKDWVVVGADAQTLLEQGFTAVGKDFPVFLHPITHEEPNAKQVKAILLSRFIQINPLP